MQPDERLEKILKGTGLKTRLKVTNEMMLITLLTELGFREDKAWSPEEDEMLHKLMEWAKKFADVQVLTIQQWETDGRPE